MEVNIGNIPRDTKFSDYPKTQFLCLRRGSALKETPILEN